MTAASSKKPQLPPAPSRSTSPPPTKRAKVAPSGDEDGDVDMDDAPKNLRQGDVVTKVVEDMGAVIIEVVMKPFAKRRHEEMMVCMKEMRKVSLEEGGVGAPGGISQYSERQAKEILYSSSCTYNACRHLISPSTLYFKLY
ncbi:hypothetical protein BKA70DRAFT_1556132 [Coprinopsis sp. MPI-PUGE-AT-0042]|nr:hypothetical protein BKA70DRAFT_1556132 [Coprinopsis sp. MPI-PUGE-AT-0042]